jgi:hypothetical protein
MGYCFIYNYSLFWIISDFRNILWKEMKRFEKDHLYCFCGWDWTVVGFVLRSVDCYNIPIISLHFLYFLLVYQNLIHTNNGMEKEWANCWIKISISFSTMNSFSVFPISISPFPTYWQKFKSMTINSNSLSSQHSQIIKLNVQYFPIDILILLIFLDNAEDLNFPFGIKKRWAFKIQAYWVIYSNCLK